MGLFDKLKKTMKNDEVKVSEENENEAIGWRAIEEEFLRVYPGQNNPKHYGTLISWMLGGNDPLDGISIYDGGDYWHFVSFGQTELYEKESDTKEISGYGYELTFKLKKDYYEDEEAEIRNICGILQMIARLTFTKGEIFRPFEFIYTTVETIKTPNGTVEFLELIGMTDAELKTLSTVESVMEIYKKLGSDITDYHRESLV